MIELAVPTPAAMERIGAALAGVLVAGDVVTLDGELGAGKTTLTRGLGAALGVRGTVASPTFVLARTHPRPAGGPSLVHVDAYRMGGAAELDDLDLDLARSITVIEWGAAVAPAIVDAFLEVRIDRPLGDGGGTGDEAATRSVRVSGHGDRWLGDAWDALRRRLFPPSVE